MILNENQKFILKTIILAAIVLIIIMGAINVVSAEVQTLGTFQQNTCVELKQTCGNCSYVNISSVLYPNSTVALEEAQMNQTGVDFRYTFCETSTNGQYIVNTYGDPDGASKIPVAYDFDINPSGVESTDQRSNIMGQGAWALFGIAVLFFLGFLFINSNVPTKLTFLVFAIIFVVAGFNVIFITMKNEAVSSDLVNLFSGLTVIMFYFYYFAAGFLIILWLFTFLNTWLYKKNQRQMQRLGGYEG